MKPELQAAISDFKSKQRDLVKLVQSSFADATREIFDKYESLQSFGWHQYTQYFNDGDDCTFSAYIEDDSLEVNGSRADDYPQYAEKKWVGGARQYAPNPEYDPNFNAMVKEISEFLQSIGENILEEVFGDHKEITVTREGAMVEDYTDHD